MNELYVFCEGPTEQGFCSQVLASHLFPGSDGRLHTIKIAHSKHHGKVHRGGIGKYGSLKRDIKNTLRSRSGRNVYFTTMIDLYALPNDFPGKPFHVRDPHNPTPYVLALEDAFTEDIGDRRFVPYLQLHEYETMLFAQPEAFLIAFDGVEAQVEALKEIAASFASVEHIDDGPNTAPSKRIIELIPAYLGRKVTHGPDIAEFIGTAAIRAQCPHFGQWLTRLEVLARGVT